MARTKIAVITFLLMGFTALAAYGVAQKVMSVQVRKGQIRTSPSFIGKIVTKLPYGEQVDVLEEKEGWHRVEKPGTQIKGWMHASALTEKKIVVKPGAKDVKQAASSDELTLAGKGFNEQVEKSFKSKNPKVDFSGVDRMESVTISQKEILKFVKQGQLEPKEVPNE
jgi:hypothetical protein